jgi:hypothetical protein
MPPEVLAEAAVSGVLRVSNRELGLPPLRRLVGQAGQRGPYQPSVDGSILGTVGHIGSVGHIRLLRCVRRLWHHGDGFGAWEGLGWGNGYLLGRLRPRGAQARADLSGHALQHLLIQHPGHLLLATLRRNLRLLVLVLRVTRGTPGLFHLVANHGDDGVVCDSALAGTVVIHDVTEPRLALLHQAPKRTRFL